MFNVDTRAGLQVGTVSDLVHQGLHLADDYRLGRNTLLEESKSRKAEYDLDIRSQEEKLILRNRELENREIMRKIEEHRAERAESQTELGRRERFHVFVSSRPRHDSILTTRNAKTRHH